MLSLVDFLPIATFGLTATQMIMLGVGAAGVGASIYGSNKQSDAIADANRINQQTEKETNASAWANYLMTRGVNPNGAVTGQIPTNPQAINTRLPLWANANFKTGTGKSGWRKKGSAGGAANTLVKAPVAPAYALPVAPANPYGSYDPYDNNTSNIFG